MGQRWEELRPEVHGLGGSRQVVALDSNPNDAGEQALPTIVLHGRYSDLWNGFYSQDARLCVERVYAEALFAARCLGRDNRLGRRIAMPVMFSALHGVPFELAIELQKDFATDLLSREATVQEVMICIFQDGDRLLDAYQLAIGDQLSVAQAALEPWVRDGIMALSAQLRGGGICWTTALFRVAYRIFLGAWIARRCI